MRLIEVDKGNQLVAEEDLTARVADLDLAQSDGESAQSLGETKVASAIGKPAVLLNLAHLEAGRVLDRRQAVGKGDRTGAIAAGGGSQAQRVVWTNQVVALAKVIELALAVFEGGEVEVAQDFELERAMEALVFALGLRVISPTMSDADAEPDQPQAEGGEVMVVVGAPGSAIVHQHCGRQSITAEGAGQHAAHGLAALVGAGLEHQREARMVVEHGQRMAAAAAEQGEVALEVHLPEFVRRRAFEALQRALSKRGGTVEQPRAAQDAGHGARRQRWAPLACEQPRKLASAPRVARLVAQPDHRLFDFSRSACRTAQGPLRAIFETARARPRVTHQPLVAGLRRDPEAPAQLAPVHSRLQRQLHKLLAQRHPGTLPPRHPVHLPLEAQHAV